MHPTEVFRMNRRQWLLEPAPGFGGLALTHMLAIDGALGGVIRPDGMAGCITCPRPSESCNCS